MFNIMFLIYCSEYTLLNIFPQIIQENIIERLFLILNEFKSGSIVVILLLFSSLMISIHNSTHSSQIKTVGPAISFLTSCWLLPQKEQYKMFLLPDIYF